MALAARQVLDMLDATVDGDRPEHLDRRLGPYVRERRYRVPRRPHEWEGQLPRVPAQVPAHSSPLAADLARAAIVGHQGATEPKHERPRLHVKAIQRIRLFGAPVRGRVFVVEPKGPESRMRLVLDSPRGIERRVADPVSLPLPTIGAAEVPGLVDARPRPPAGPFRRL